MARRTRVRSGNRRPSPFSGGRIEFMGDREMLRKIEEMADERTMNSICYEALTKSAEPVKAYMDDFLDLHLKGNGIPWPHTQVTRPQGTGQSKRNFEYHPWWKGSRMNLIVGYNFSDYVYGDHEQQGALQALFLDIGTRTPGGTPRIVPTFFVYYAVRNSLTQVEAIQNEVIQRRLMEIWNRRMTV